MVKVTFLLVSALAAVCGLTSCHTTAEVNYIEPITLRMPSVNKTNPKSIKVALLGVHSDLYGEVMDNTKLEKLNYALTGFGDKSLMLDMVIKDMLFHPGKGLYGAETYDSSMDLEIPTKEEMKADPKAFVQDAYMRLFNREPSVVELNDLSKYIKDEPDVDPILFYYALMSSDEYEYY